MPQWSPHLAVKWLDRLRSPIALLKVCHHFLPLLHTTKGVLVLGFLFLVLCGVSIHIRVQAKNSNGTTVRTLSNFNLLCGRCTLLPFPSALTSLCAPVVLCSPFCCYLPSLFPPPSLPPSSLLPSSLSPSLLPSSLSLSLPPSLLLTGEASV